MEHLGDITKIRGAEAPIVEVVIGGSPCQGLSQAGKRKGLADNRSVLFLEQIRVIKEMREYDKKTNARTGADVRPRYMVWENVPGAFSSNEAEDFRIVLEQTAKIEDPDAVVPRPPKGKWTNAGCIMGDGWSIAWRVLDAKFWGVPQRRRRIALVADFGGESAPEILFEREGVSRYTPERGEERERTSSDSERSTYGAITIGFKPRNGSKARSIGAEVETAPTLETSNNVAICIQGNCIDRADTAVCNGKGWREDDASFTLNTVDRPAVYDARGNGSGEIVPTITGDHEGRITDYTAVVMRMKGFGYYCESETASTCKGRDGKDNTDLIVCAVDCRNGTENPEINGTLQAKSTGGSSLNLQNVVRVRKTVRRLTPLEYERLQGYPDGWTDIGTWTDSKGKKRKSKDGLRYKALGNSIARPPWRFVLSRVNEYLTEHTMGSLFDGIGGFPLIWRELNGDGKCLWASEIEDFPIAVTKKRFAEMQEATT